LRQSRSWGDRLRSAVVVNWPTKLTALVLSGVLWAAVAAEEPTNQLVPVTLVVQPPPGRAFAGPMPVVQAVYVGSTRELIKLYSSPPTIRKVLPDTLSGSEFQLTLSTQDLLTPGRINVRAQDVQPRTIRLTLDAIGRRTVEVESRVVIVPDSGYALLQGIAVEPGSVTVSGPDSAVRAIASVSTVSLELRDVDGPVRRLVPLDTASLGPVRVAPSEVAVSAEVVFMSERVLMGVPVTIRSDRAAMLVVDPPAVLVTVRGSSRRLARLTRDSILVIAAPETTDVPARVRLEVVPPEGLTGVATPDTAVVTRRTSG
jgi:YbbR-like protein